MREHMGLFRGKRVDNGEWVEGNLVDCPQNFRCKRIVNFGCLSAGVITRWEQDVIPETVGECTGLKDKNGKLIFEGDIVDCWSEGVQAKGIIQRRVDGLWFIYPAWQKRIIWSLRPNRNGETTVKIIGNIHDNPELMEGAGEHATD